MYSKAYAILEKIENELKTESEIKKSLPKKIQKKNISVKNVPGSYAKRSK